MVEAVKSYNIDDYNSWKRKQGKDFRFPPRQNYLAAATHIRNLLDGKKFNWAAMGGLAMLCLGSRRDMADIHIVYDDRDFQRIRAKLESDPRARLPKSMNNLFPAKILLGTGPKYKDAGCTENVDVEIDLIPPGSDGTPPNDVLRKNQVLLRLNIDGKMSNFKGLNMLYLVKSTLALCKDQEIMWDPRRDLMFLCAHYGKDVEQIRTQLNEKDLRERFFKSSYYSSLSIDEQRRCSLVLLGQNYVQPNPSMSVTPPPSQSTQRMSMVPNAAAAAAAAAQDPRPRLQSHKSTPSLGHSTQPPSSHLSPPLPGKAPRSKPSTSSTPPANSSEAMGTKAPIVPVYSAGREARSRYRPISAPNTPNASQNTNSLANAGPIARSTSMEPTTQQQVVGEPFSAPRTVGVQNLANIAKPQVITNRTPGSLTASPGGQTPRKSMPNLKAAPQPGNIPPIPHDHFGHTGANGPSIATQRNPGHGSPLIAVPQGHQRRAASQGTNKLEEQRRGLSTQGAMSGQLSAQHPRHLHTKSASSSAVPMIPNASQAEPDSPTAGLRIVGPGGIYPPPSQRPTHRSNMPQSSTSRVVGSPPVQLSPSYHPEISPPAGFIAELPATSPTPAPPVVSPLDSPQRQPPNIPTELPTSCHIPRQEQIMAPQELPADSPVRPQPVPAPVSTQQPNLPSRPQHPRTHSEPITSLPVSLMPGGLGIRQRSPQSSISQIVSPPAQAQNELVEAQTNAQRYQSYNPNLRSAPTSAQPSPKPAVVSGYKAYSGAGSPPKPAAKAPAKLQKAPPKSYLQEKGSPPQQNAPRLPEPNLPQGLVREHGRRESRGQSSGTTFVQKPQPPIAVAKLEAGPAGYAAYHYHPAPVQDMRPEPRPYQAGEEVRYAKLQPSTQKGTGYEEFAHSPYTPVVGHGELPQQQQRQQPYAPSQPYRPQQQPHRRSPPQSQNPYQYSPPTTSYTQNQTHHYSTQPPVSYDAPKDYAYSGYSEEGSAKPSQGNMGQGELFM